MSESPVLPSTSITESPVLEPSVFLLYRSNRAFAERRSDFPTLGGKAPPIHGKDFTFLAPYVVGTLLVLITLALIDARLLAHPFVFLVVLILILLFYRIARDVRSTIAPPDLAGWIIPGTVTDSEKIRIEGQSFQQNRLGIWYQFQNPYGTMLEGYAEGDSRMASDPIAPPPGSPVRVWYDDNNNHYLL